MAANVGFSGQITQKSQKIDLIRRPRSNRMQTIE